MAQQKSLLTVDKYLAKLDPDERKALQKVREAILKAAPMAEEAISYQVPTYRYMGPLVHFAAMKNHLSLICVDKELVKSLSKELKAFKVSGTTIHFSAEKIIPPAVISKLVKARVAKNRSATKKTIATVVKKEIGKVQKCDRGHTWKGSGPCMQCHGGFLALLDL